MKTNNASYSIIKQEGNLDVLKYIESIGRVCYKSEDRITKTSAKNFTNSLVANEHYAMIEHFRFIALVPVNIYNMIYGCNPKYIEMTNIEDSPIISYSARSIIDLYKELEGKDNEVRNALLFLALATAKTYNAPELFGDMLKDDFDNSEEWCCKFYTSTQIYKNGVAEEIMTHCWVSVRMICDRGVTHEIVRMRPCSFAQESTRYVNYKNKGMSFISIDKALDLDLKTKDLDKSVKDHIKAEWEEAMKHSEQHYNNLLALGASPQLARGVLATDVKSEIVITANLKEWKHIFELRDDTHAHPKMREICSPLHQEFISMYGEVLA